MEYPQRDTNGLLEDLRDLRGLLSDIRAIRKTNFRILFGAIIATGLNVKET